MPNKGDAQKRVNPRALRQLRRDTLTTRIQTQRQLTYLCARRFLLITIDRLPQDCRFFVGHGRRSYGG